MLHLAFLRFSSSLGSSTEPNTSIPPPSTEVSGRRPRPKLRPLHILTKASRRAPSSPTESSPTISRPILNKQARPLPSNNSPVGGTPPTVGEIPIRAPPALPLYPFPIAKSASLPTANTSSHFYPPAPRLNPKLHVNTHNLSRNSYAGKTDARRVDHDWSRYPIAKHLSPIAEQDYVSPASLLDTIPLPGSAHSATPKAAISVLRKESQRSDITRPSPVYSHHQAFVSRPLNRSLSQASSIHTPRSLSSSTPVSAATSASAPSIPPLDLTPAFPGPHRANTLEGGPTRRNPPPPSPLSYVSSATDWENSRCASEQDAQSYRNTLEGGPAPRNPPPSPLSYVSSATDLEKYSRYTSEHDAQSYRTASESRTLNEEEEEESEREAEDFDFDVPEPPSPLGPSSSQPAVERQEERLLAAASTGSRSDSAAPAMPSPVVITGAYEGAQPQSPPLAASTPLSNSSSFIHRRWDRIRAFEESESHPGSGALAMPRVEQRGWTPAALIFWLGFCFPLLWLFGGWYFTVYQETGMTWAALVKQEHRYPGKHRPSESTRRYENTGPNSGGKSAILLPLWAMHDCHPPDAVSMSGLTVDERRSIQKLYLGYPFVNCNRAQGLPQHVDSPPQDVHAGPFKLLSKIPIVAIDLLGSDEDCSTRRTLDPWIWRCRVAFVLFGISAIVVSITLVAIYLPRAL